MGAYKRGRTFTIRVPTRSGVIARTAGTGHKPLVREMEKMLEVLGPRGRRDWELLDAVADGRLTVAQLHDAYSRQDLDGLRARLSDVDLAALIPDWQRALCSTVAEKGGTPERYLVHVRSLMPEGVPFPRSRFTFQVLTDWLAERAVGPSTKRRYHAAMSSFSQYLVKRGVIPRNPMRDVDAPSAAAPRMRYLDQSDVLRLIEAQREPYRTLSALLHGTGLEVSVALALKCRDIDPSRREIRARGTKTHARDRIAKVASWAWSFIDARIALLTPNALLFPGINRWTASDEHRAACAALGIEDYTQRDGRHTYAVRAVRAGAPFEVVASQLGHANIGMVVKVYGRFRPSEAEMTRWELVAEAQDRGAINAV